MPEAALHQQSIAALSRRLREGSLSPVTLTEAFLARIDAYNERLHAYIAVYADAALEAARLARAALSSGHCRGPLHGVPIAIKDNFWMAGRVTTMGSKAHAKFVPDDSATVVKRLEAAGAIILGKLNLHEYALGVTTENPHYGIARNPWNGRKTTGGSSGGAGAAVAAGLAAGAIGSDTSGSIRIPAACCGIIGLKPTYGLVSKYGCFPEAWSLDHVGPMTRTVDDAALVLNVIAGPDPHDPASLRLPFTPVGLSDSGDLTGLRLGINHGFFFRDVDAPIHACVMRAIHRLEKLGATLIDVDIAHIGNAEHALTLIDTSETTAVHHDQLREHGAEYGEDVRQLIECGELPSAVDYIRAQQERSRIQVGMAAAFAHIDALVAPTLPMQVPDIGQRDVNINGAQCNTVENLMRLVGPANLLGLPSLSVPCGLFEGMPVGVQIVGRPLDEVTVMRVGRAVERTTALVLPALPRDD